MDDADPSSSMFGVEEFVGALLRLDSLFPSCQMHAVFLKPGDDALLASGLYPFQAPLIEGNCSFLNGLLQFGAPPSQGIDKAFGHLQRQASGRAPEGEFLPGGTNSSECFIALDLKLLNGCGRLLNAAFGCRHAQIPVSHQSGQASELFSEFGTHAALSSGRGRRGAGGSD